MSFKQQLRDSLNKSSKHYFDGQGREFRRESWEDMELGDYELGELDQAQASLEAYVESIIGEDEDAVDRISKAPDGKPLIINDVRKVARNDLRAEQRRKLKEQL